MELNKIYLGNAYELIKDIPDKSIDLIYTDIPYQTCYNGGGCIQHKVKNMSKVINEEKETLLQGIDYSILNEFVRVLKNIYIYIWCSKSQIYDLMSFFVGEHKCNFNILVWCKDNPVPMGGSPFLNDIEYCLVFSEKGVKYNNGWEHKGKWYVSHINQQDKKDFKHNTIKPIELVEKHLLNSTQENDIILDPFIGSGTTALACKHLKRNFVGFELKEEWWKIANDRLKGINANGEMNLFDYVENEETEWTKDKRKSI